jgi:membrane protein
MYLSAYVFLFGAELNAELEHQTAKDTTEGAPKPMGERGAWPANHVAGGEQPSKPNGGDVSPPQQQDSQQQREPTRQAVVDQRPSTVDDYVAGRMANRAGSLAGLRSVGMVSAILSTLGLSLLRRRGKAAAGATLLATAAGLSLLKRRG